MGITLGWLRGPILTEIYIFWKLKKKWAMYGPIAVKLLMDGINGRYY